MKTFEFVFKCSIKFDYFSSNGGCQDCKVYQGLFVFTVQVQGWSCWCRSWPISATYHTNIGLAVTVIFIFGLGRCSCIGYFDHIPNSQLKWRKLRCHPLVYRKICPKLLLPRSMLRIIVEKGVGHPFTQKIIFDFPPSERQLVMSEFYYAHSKI